MTSTTLVSVYNPQGLQLLLSANNTPQNAEDNPNQSHLCTLSLTIMKVTWLTLTARRTRLLIMRQCVQYSILPTTATPSMVLPSSTKEKRSQSASALSNSGTTNLSTFETMNAQREKLIWSLYARLGDKFTCHKCRLTFGRFSCKDCPIYSQTHTNS